MGAWGGGTVQSAVEAHHGPIRAWQVGWDVNCVFWGWCPNTNKWDDTLSPSHHETVKPKHPRYDCHLALVTSLDCHGRAVRTPFGLRWERCSAVDNECIHPSDSIRWLIKIKLVRPSNMWTLIISIFNVEEECQQSSHHNPVLRSFRSKECCSDT